MGSFCVAKQNVLSFDQAEIRESKTEKQKLKSKN